LELPAQSLTGRPGTLTIEDFVLYSNDHFESNLPGNGLCQDLFTSEKYFRQVGQVRTNAILVEYIKSEQYLNVSQKNTRINGTV